MSAVMNPHVESSLDPISTRMMIRRLIYKDWYFQRWSIVGYLVAGAVGVTLIGVGSTGAFFAGSIALITVLVSVGVQLAMFTLVHERSEQTLPFVMSLPISPRHYTIAKLTANLLIFLIPWMAMFLGTCGVILIRPGMPHGLLPFAVLVLTELFAAYSLILATALLSESQAWTIGAMVVTNLFFQGYLYVVVRLPGIAGKLNGPRAIWSPNVIALLVGQLATIALLLGLAFFLQNRKRDFL